MIRLRNILAGIALIASATAISQDSWTKWGPTDTKTNAGVLVRAGYTIGGTTPLPLPNEIRSINEFSPKGGATVGADIYKMFSKRWGFSVGWHFFYEGFKTSADVKNYRVSLSMDGNVMEGYFTGTNVTETYMWGMTMPVLATFRMSPRWNINFGPYISTYFKQDFTGEVYDTDEGVGYLRVDTPMGEKVNMDRTKPTPYPDNFSDSMHRWSGGVELGFDWKACRHMNAFAKVDWGLTNIWQGDFDAISFKMYPIYATLGLAYRY